MTDNLTRRVFLGHAAGAVTAVALVSSCTGEAETADPTVAAIEAHKTAWAAWQALDDTDDPTWDQLGNAEVEAWEGVCEIHPTTMAGVAAMSGYIGRFCLSDLPPDGTAIYQAFLTIATVAARLAYLEGRG